MTNRLFHTLSASVLRCAVSDAASADVQPSGAPAEPPEVVITIKTAIAGKVEFVFQDYKIHFLPDSRFGRPTGATVNGIPWPDLEKPFEMGFTPDFSFAEIYEKSGRGAIALAVKRDQFVLSVDDSGDGSAPYQISISMKRQPVAATQEKSAPADGKMSSGSASARSSAKPAGHGKPAKRKWKR